MSFLNIVTDVTGLVGVHPRTVYITCNDSYAEVTAANFLKAAESQGYNFYPTDKFNILYGTNSDTFGFFLPTITSTTITLSPYIGEGNVTTPVVSGNFPKFSGTTGLMIDSGISPSNAAKTKMVMANGAVVSGNMPSYVDAAGTIGDSSLATNTVLTSSITTPNTNSNLVTFDVTVGQAALAAGGSVTLYASTGSKQFKVRNLWINRGGTNFSGGGGDRLGQITDNTTVYSVIPATNMQTLINGGWGMSTPLPFPAAAAINTNTVAGQSLVFKYSGGTTDYTAGSIVVSGLLERVA